MPVSYALRKVEGIQRVCISRPVGKVMIPMWGVLQYMGTSRGYEADSGGACAAGVAGSSFDGEFRAHTPSPRPF
eukprot:g1597.t1